jgi:hypothetical protein
VRQVGRSRLRCWLAGALLAMVAVVGLGVATPAFAVSVAGVNPGPASDAFKSGQHVYVYPSGEALLDKANEARIETELTDSKVWLTVVKTPPIGRADAKPVSDAIAAATGAKGSYVLLAVGGSGTFLQVSSPLLPDVFGAQLRAAIAAHHDDPAGQALQLVTALAGDKLPTKPFPWGTVIAVVVVVVALLVLVLVVWRRQRRRRRALQRRRDDARVDVESLADDLLITDPAGRVALRDDDANPEQRALRVAWSRLQAAEGMLGGAADRATVDRARALVAQGRAALEHAQRLHDGVPEEQDVLRLAAQGSGPDPSQRKDQAQSEPPARQRLLPQWTAASYPGYGYGWYPGYGYGFYDYGGSFVTGLLAGELLTEAFSPWGGFGGFGGYAGYEGGGDPGASFGNDSGGVVQGGDPSYGTDSWDGSTQGDLGSNDSGSYDGGGDPSYGSDGGDFGGDSGGGGDS